MVSRPLRFLPSLAILLTCSGVARAHEVGGTDSPAPIPLDLLFAGAGATVALTAVGLALANPTSTNDDDPPQFHLGVVPPALVTAIQMTVRGLFLLAFVIALFDGLAGRQVAAENLATVFVWPVWIKGVALLAVLVGNPWSTLSPWQAIYDGLTRLEGKPIALFEYPIRLDQWPALIGFLGVVGIVENLTVVPNSPRATAILVAGYALVMVLGAVAFGPKWLRRADAFAVLYRLLGRVAPIRATRQTDGGRGVAVVPPWHGTTASAGSMAVMAFVVAVVYTVSFDGFTSTPEYQELLFGLRDAGGLVGAVPGNLVQITLHLTGFTLFVGAYLLVAGLTARLDNSNDALTTARMFALTILPIAAAYEVAHNYPFVIGNIARVLSLAGEPLGVILEIAPLAWLSLSAFWASQVVLIVGGHVVAVVAVHIVSTNRRAPPRVLVPLSLLMVGYTLVSLWIISRPVVS